MEAPIQQANLVRPPWWQERISLKHVRPRTAMLIANWLHRCGASVVFTNGCFDCLHRGHLRLLSFARLQGTFLIVAVNSDASVRRLKGPSRPIQPLKDRLTVLRGLSMVDMILVFGTPGDNDRPDKLCRLLRPDILVRGADEPTPWAGAEWCGKCRPAPMTPGVSTTLTAERLSLR